MDRMLYITMSGAKQVMEAQRANTSNLANANTTGFKADLAAFRSMPVYGPGYASRVYGMTERPGVDLSAGMLNTTDRELDLAIKGDGWFTVQARDGSEAYSRDGNMRISTGGLLVNGAGYPMMGENGPVVIPPAEKVEIGADGTISIVALGQAPNALAVLDRLRLVNPAAEQLEKGSDGLMRLQNGELAVPDAAVSVVSGALESSNVNPIEAMVNMITLARQFEMQMKSIKAAEESDASTTQMMRLS